MYGYIYKITNLINQKLYIGKHKYPKAELDPNYFCSGVLIRKAIKKYGRDNFVSEIIDTSDSEEDLNLKEIKNIELYDCISPKGYNLTEGGDGISNPSVEIRNKISISKTGKRLSPEHKEKIGVAAKKIKHHKEWVNKISNSLKGRKPSDKTLQAAYLKNKNSKWCNNGIIEKKYIGNLPDGFTNGRLRNPFPVSKGRKLSPEATRKMSEDKKGSVWYNNGEKEIMLKMGFDIPSGFIRGRLKNKNQ